MLVTETAARAPIPTPANALVQHALRTRTAIITALMTLWADPSIAKGRCCDFSPRRKPPPSNRSATRSLGKFCTRCGPRRNGQSARGCRSAATTQRGRDSPFRAAARRNILRAPPTSIRAGVVAEMQQGGAGLGSTPMATATATVSSNTIGQTKGRPVESGNGKDSAGRGIPSQRPVCRGTPSLFAKVQAYVYGRSSTPRCSPAARSGIKRKR